MSSVNLDTLGISVDELQNFEAEELNQLVETLCEGKSETERTAIIDAIRTELDEAVGEYEEMLEGAKEDEDRYRDMDNDMGEARAEEEQNELKEIINYLEDEAETVINAAEAEYLKTHYSTAEDLMLTTSDFENGDKVIIEATSNLEEIFEDTSEDYKEGTDYNNDGIVNFTDYELFTQDQKTAMYDNYQDIFLTLDPGYTVTNTEFSGDKVVYTVSNGEKTVTYEIQNISDGVHIFFDSTQENFITSDTYKSWPAELQKITYFGDSLNSVYDNEHPVSDAEKLNYVNGYQETSDAIENIVNEFATSSAETVSEKVQEYTDMLFAFYNDPVGATIEDIWADIYADMAELGDKVQSDILTSLMYTVASANDKETTELLFSSQAPKIEDIFFKGGLDETEMMSVMFLESFVATGYYGGVDVFWAQPSIDAVTIETAGSIFYTNSAGGLEINPNSEYAQYFADIDTTIAAMGAFKDSLKFVSWASDNGVVAATIDALETKEILDEQGVTDVVGEEYYTAATEAKDMIDKTDAKGLEDGIDQSDYEAQLKALLNLVTAEKSIEQLAKDVIEALTLIQGVHAAWVDDLAAGFVHYLNKAAPELVKSLCMIDGWSTEMENFIDTDTKLGDAPDRADSAKDTLDKYKDAANAASIAAEYGMSVEEYEAAVRDALIQLNGEEWVQTMENMSLIGNDLNYSSYDLNDLLQAVEDKA